jgi:hypothetical protein
MSRLQQHAWRFAGAAKARSPRRGTFINLPKVLRASSLSIPSKSHVPGILLDVVRIHKSQSKACMALSSVIEI